VIPDQVAIWNRDFMTSRLGEIAITQEEMDCLMQVSACHEWLNTLLQSQAKLLSGGKFAIRLDRAAAEKSRELLTVRLAEVGFDKHYNPTHLGRTLEELIDKLFQP